MTVTNGYCTVEELQRHIDAGGDASFAAGDYANMEIAIEAASRWIDEMTGSRFYAAVEARVYTAPWYDLLYIDDAIAVTAVKSDDDGDGVYETVWATTDYILEPRGAAQRGRPYRQIRIAREGRYSFTRLDGGVEVTGSFGYGATPPAPVKQACLLVAHRLWRRQASIFGVAGTPGLGVTVIQARITADSDVMALLQAVDARIV